MGKLRYLSATFHPSLVEGCPQGIKCQAFPGHPAYGLNKFPQPSGKSHQEGKQITRGGGGGVLWSGKLSVLKVNSEVGWREMRRSSHSLGYYGNLILYTDRTKGSQRQSPSRKFNYFRMGWTPGKINIAASLLPSFSCFRSASQSTDYQDGERLGHSLRVSQRLGGLSAHDKKHRQSILGKCHPYPIKNAQQALITHQAL